MRGVIRRIHLASVLLSIALVALGIAGCGATSASTASGTDGQATSATVSTASATVAGSSETILTDGRGRTLYYFDDDTNITSACTTGCNSTWPPLTLSSGIPTSNTTLSGALTAHDVGNGMQVLYNGHPLYRYSGDTAAGQTNGDGIDGKWHVTTPNVAENTGTTGGTGPQPTPTICSGPYCY